MRRSAPSDGAARRRDAALRRLRVTNRLLVGAAVAATALLSDVAAQAFSGHRRTVHPAVSAAVPAGGSRGSGDEQERATTGREGGDHGRGEGRSEHGHQGSLRRPDSAPAAATTTSAQATPAPAAAPVQQAPAPVVSGGS